MPQLTIRSAITGFLLGGLLSATALYIAGKTGITIGVGVTSVIMAFAIYRLLAQAGIAEDFTILENNCTQSVATAAGYMVTPLVSGLAAYMLVTERLVPWWHGWAPSASGGCPATASPARGVTPSGWTAGSRWRPASSPARR